MKVVEWVIKINEGTTIQFGLLNIGDCFKYKDDFYIRTKGGNETLSFTDFTAYGFDDNTKVMLVDVDIVFNNIDK